METSNKTKLKTIHERIAAIDSLLRYMKDGDLAKHMYDCLSDIWNECESIMRQIEKDGCYNEKSKSEDYGR